MVFAIDFLSPPELHNCRATGGQASRWRGKVQWQAIVHHHALVGEAQQNGLPSVQQVDENTCEHQQKGPRKGKVMVPPLSKSSLLKICLGELTMVL